MKDAAGVDDLDLRLEGVEGAGDEDLVRRIRE